MVIILDMSECEMLYEKQHSQLLKNTTRKQHLIQIRLMSTLVTSEFLFAGKTCMDYHHRDATVNTGNKDDTAKICIT